MSRYRREAELRNKNKQLESAKWEVSSKLMEAEVGNKLDSDYPKMISTVRWVPPRFPTAF